MPEHPEDLSAAFLQLADLAEHFIEASAGYRRMCETAGFSPIVAEQMAMVYHSYILTVTAKGSQ